MPLTVNVCQPLLPISTFAPCTRSARYLVACRPAGTLVRSSTGLLVSKEFLHIFHEAYDDDHGRACRAQKKDQLEKVHGSSHKNHDRIVARLPFATRLKSEEMLDSRR
jgi:hypothetical protein